VAHGEKMNVAARRLSAGEAGLGANFLGSSSSPTILQKRNTAQPEGKAAFLF